MALIVRIDVDRPYGRAPIPRHLLSRLSSDLYFPKISMLGYLRELAAMLRVLNEQKARAYIFFRRCTLPSAEILKLIDDGGHEIGLHLENSRSFENFQEEKQILEKHIGRKVRSVSKHGSGGAKYGYHHYAPYEPDRYAEWAQKAGIKVLLGNKEDPTIEPTGNGNGFTFFPSAFWLEPYWRDVTKFTVDWLLGRAATRDTVLLVHPENVLDSAALTESFRKLVSTLETKILA